MSLPAGSTRQASCTDPEARKGRGPQDDKLTLWDLWLGRTVSSVRRRGCNDQQDGY
jgi:hypothetical protein